MNKKYKAAAMIPIIVMLFFTGCYDPDGDQTFESPFGDDEVIVKVDYLSCPDVFYEGKRIFEYDGPGFNETVYWDVEWISEDEIRLYIPGSRWTERWYVRSSYSVRLFITNMLSRKDGRRTRSTTS